MNKAESFVYDLEGRRLYGEVVTEHGRPRPTIVVCHGFKGFMDWGFFPALADLLASRGFCVVRFNFGGSGMRPGDELVTDTEAFRNATFSQDLRELTALIASLGQQVARGLVDPDRIGLFGHSRGGGTALLAAANLSIRALVTWAAVATFDRLAADEHQTWRQTGSLPIVNARTGQTLELGRKVFEDLETNAARLDLVDAAGRRQAPWLIVHGDRDETVPFAEARKLQAGAAEPVELLPIAGGDHTLGSSHPFSGPTPELVTAMNATQAWFRKYLTPRAH